MSRKAVHQSADCTHRLNKWRQTALDNLWEHTSITLITVLVLAGRSISPVRGYGTLPKMFCLSSGRPCRPAVRFGSQSADYGDAQRHGQFFLSISTIIEKIDDSVKNVSARTSHSKLAERRLDNRPRRFLPKKKLAETQLLADRTTNRPTVRLFQR